MKHKLSVMISQKLWAALRKAARSQGVDITFVVNLQLEERYLPEVAAKKKEQLRLQLERALE